MENAPALADAVAQALTEKALAGLRGYPGLQAGRDQLWRTVQDAAVSVSHARAFLAVFDNLCPTPREIKDAAFATRDQFLPRQPSQIEQWEREFGKPQKLELDEPLGNWQQQDREMWAKIKKLLKVQEFSKVAWGQVYSAKRRLGYPLLSHEREEADKWDATHPNVQYIEGKGWRPANEEGKP